MAAQAWQPYASLTQAPTNLKEAIDWVLRVTGRDGKSNKAAASPPKFACLCYLAKAIKDLLYDAKDPGSPGPSTHRNWDDLLLEQESDIVHPVLTDLGLLSGGSTSAASTRDTCAGGTEVIKALIDQLALGLQKWVGWQETGDECCLKGGSGGQSTGIGKKCTCPAVGVGGAGCCSTGGSGTCNCNSAGKNCCYKSAYKRPDGASSGSGGTSSSTDFLWPTISSDSTKVHLLARIFLGSVCLIWSGLSQLGWLTKEGSDKRWKDGTLSKETDGLGSFMAAMGYDLERLNQGTGPEKKGEFVHTLLTKEKEGVPWQEFASVKDKLGGSVAEYYSSIYGAAQSAGKGSTEDICTKYPLLVLHILASGYFRAGSAGAKGIIPAPKAPSSDPRKPRTIREILYWLSALPYSKGYRELVERMQAKYPTKEGTISLEGTGAEKTQLSKDCVTHYLMAACGYCPLVLIGIQGTIATSGTDSDTSAPGPPAAGSGSPSEKNRCPEHKKNPKSKRCTLEDANKTTDTQAQSTDGQLKPGQVCYGGYHLEVKDFGPLHGMYANGLFGFDMEGSPAQCLDQLRVYVYHCFYQLYFLRKQCGAGVVDGGTGTTVLGWKSCRYGNGLDGAGAENWICQKSSSGNGKCKCYSGKKSPLMLFLCDSVNNMHCGLTKGKGVNDYPEIVDHIEAKDTIQPPHFGKPPMHCPVPMGWQAESTGSSTSGGQNRENHFKDLNNGSHKQASLTTGQQQKYPAHCTGNTLALLLEYYCDPEKCQSGTLVVLLRLLACITPTVPRTLGDLFGFYYYIVYIGGKNSGEVTKKLKSELQDVRLGMSSSSHLYSVVGTLATWNGDSGTGCTSGCKDTLRCLYGDKTGKQCSQYLCPLSGQQYGQLSPLMAGTYLSWLVYLIEGFQRGLEGLKGEFTMISCKDSECHKGPGGGGCGDKCVRGKHGENSTCCCDSVVSCTGVLPVLYKYGFGYGNVTELHKGQKNKQCHDFLKTLESVLQSKEFVGNGDFKTGLIPSVNQLIYTTRLPWIFVLTIAWLVAVLYLAFGAIWPLDWAHMRSHCRGWFRKGSLSPWEVLMVGKKKGRGILEFFGKT